MVHRMCSSLMRWWEAVEVIEEILRAGEGIAAEIEVYLVEGRSASLELRRTEISRAVESHNFALSIRTIDRGRIGTSSTSNPAAWRQCLEASVTSGRLASPQNWAGLPSEGRDEGLPLSFDPSLRPDPAILSRILDGMVSGTSRHPVDVTSGGANITVDRITLANNNGLWYERSRSLVSASIETICSQSTGSEFDNSCTTDFDPAAIGDRAGFLASESLHGKEISTGNYDVVLSPLACAQLIGTVLIPSISGRNVHAGRSRFAQSLGGEVLDPAISITDEPLLESGLHSTRWDAEGTLTRQIPFIKNGVLEAFAYDLKTAYRYEKKSTGSAVRSGPGGSPAIGSHNIVIEGPRCGVLDERAIFIQDVVGAHTANPFSGDFSVELSNPFLVEGGGYEFPVRKAMFAGNVFEMLRDVVGLGNDTRKIGNFVLPSIRLKQQHIIGGEK
jgi:PmbA protein